MTIEANNPAFFDEFSVEVNTPLDDHTPDVGGPWSRVFGNYDSINVNGPNDAIRANGPCVYYSDDLGTPDHWTAGEHITFTNSLQQMAFCVRLVDVDNWIGFIGRGTGGGGARLSKCVAGVVTDLISFQGTSRNYYRVEAEGDQVKLLESAPTDPPSWTQVGATQTISEHITETRQGLRSNANSGANWLGQYAADVMGAEPVTPIQFDGPPIADIAGTVGVPITPVDAGSLFSGTQEPFAFSETGNAWPPWAVLDPVTGFISGTPDVPDTTTLHTVTGTDADTNSAVSNTFSFVISPATVGLTLTNLSQPHSLGSPSVTQAQVIGLGDMDQPHSLGSTALSQAYAAMLLGLRQDHTLDAVGLTQAHAVALGNLDQAQRLDAVTLTLAGDISLANLRQPHELDSVALTQAYALALSALRQAHSLDSVTATPAGLLVLEALRQAHSLDGVNLTQAHAVPLGNMRQDQILEAVSLGLVVVGELAGDVVVYAMIDGQVVSYPVIDGEIYG